MKKMIQTHLSALMCCWVTCYAHARLGDGGPTATLDELLRDSDMVCASHVSGYDFATVGQTSVWLVAEFMIDHVIKGTVATNKIRILVSRLENASVTNEIRHLLVPPPQKQSRCLLFAKRIKGESFLYEMTDTISGMLPACPNKPTFPVSADSEERLWLEITCACNNLNADERNEWELVAGDWLKKRNAKKKK